MENRNITERTELHLAERGIEAVEAGDTVLGLDLLGKVPAEEVTPLVHSYLAVCLAREQGLVTQAVAMCTDAMTSEPSNPAHYLNLGRTHLLAGEKQEAIRMFRDGLLFGENRHIRRELDKLGWREPPTFPSLGREHPVNRLLGRLRTRFRSRG